jgi:serine/threonine protein kinase
MPSFELQTSHVASAAFMRHHAIASFRPGSLLSLGDEFDHGTFGSLRSLDALDGSLTTPALVVKLFSGDSLSDLGGRDEVCARIRALLEALELDGGDGWQDRLLAVPFWVFSGSFAGENRLAAATLDLRALGYRKSPFADASSNAAYLSRDQDERTDLAFSYAQGAALLERIRFLHPDQNPENLLVSDTDVQIIDFDGGVLVRTGRERPLTPGKPDDCMPPEIKRTVGVPVDLSRFDELAVRWSVGSLIGYLMLGVHPGFFLRSISGKVLDAYAQQSPGWPEIDEAGPLFTDLAQNRVAYQHLKGALDALVPDVRELFRMFFSAGLDGRLRPSARDWELAISGTREPPVIEYFEVDQDFVLHGSEVTLRWSATNSTRVEVRSYGPQDADGSISVPVERATRFVLTVSNLYGQTTAQTQLVRVISAPSLRWVEVPTSGTRSSPALSDATSPEALVPFASPAPHTLSSFMPPWPRASSLVPVPSTRQFFAGQTQAMPKAPRLFSRLPRSPRVSHPRLSQGRKRS